jgi:AbrB family looped-hinge helix DNA binding protein
MDTTKLSSKGQIVIPRSVREARGWSVGTEFIVHETAEGISLVPQKVFPETTIDAVAGCLKDLYEGPPRTTDDMHKAIKREAVRRFKESTSE